MSVSLTKNSRIFVAGHRGLVGSAILRKLKADGYDNIVLRTRSELDLLDQVGVHEFFRKAQIDAVYLAAAKVGGILANNSFQADFLYENLMLATNVIHAAAQHGVDAATVREIIARAGGLEGEIGDIAEHAVKPGGI